MSSSPDAAATSAYRRVGPPVSCASPEGPPTARNDMETHAAKTIAAAPDLEALFHALEDLPAPAHVVAVDHECTFPFVAVNRATEELMRMPRVRILGAPLAELGTVRQAG